jgi:hypothetical protein
MWDLQRLTTLWAFTACYRDSLTLLYFLVGGGVQLGPLSTAATDWPIVPALGDYDDGEFSGMKIGRGNRSTRRKPVPAPLCPPQIPLDQAQDRTRAAAVGSQRLTARAMARPFIFLSPKNIFDLWYTSKMI